jgi:cytochrome o ubiquinol oxidase subunit I
VKIFNWLFTMYRGKIKYATPMYWFLGFVTTFTVGGATGVLMAIPAADFQTHNSLFLVAHFHNVIIGGVVFGAFAGITYWFPKFFGFKLNERIGKYAFWTWLVGFLVAFMPLYLLGFMGATRRLNHYDVPDWQPLFQVAAFGSLIILAALGLQMLQIVVSIYTRNKNRDTTGDPWNGRTLEWSTRSPPPFYNFAEIPEVHEKDAFWAAKARKAAELEKEKENKGDAHQKFNASMGKGKLYHPIHMPHNTGLGFFIGALSFVVAFGLIWYMFWLAALGIIGIIACAIIRLFNKETDYLMSPEEVEAIERKEQAHATF